MKKIILFALMTFLVFGLNTANVFAEETPTQPEAETITLQGKADFNWLDMTQIERDTIIQNYKNIIFENDTVYKYKRKDFKAMHSDFVKDKDFTAHYIEAQEGINETKTYRLSGFFHGKLLVSYAIQYKNNPRTVYYYDAFGNLRFVDMISENYPNFPYWSKQYKIGGKLSSAIYFTSHDMQYMYKPDGNFRGVWFMDKMYDKNAKQILTRTNW